MPDSPTVAERLRTLRAKRNLTQVEVAKAAGVHVRTYGFWEKADTEPQASAIVKLAEFYAVSADYLLGRTDTEHGLRPGDWLVDDDRLREALAGKSRTNLPIAQRVPIRGRVVTDEECDQINDQVEEAERKHR